jgi:uncharacterized protein DUF6600
MRVRARLPLLALALGLAGCAATGFQTESPTMPAAKAGLPPEYRIFYDALEEYGDWSLIEPLGYVFRPRVSFVAWQPYQEGFWVPSDVWGWVWISSEPFGWATYHYGRWFYDTFEGWVWMPGLDWGPAWVDWRVAGSYAGWAPLGPRGMDLGSVPGGGYSYVPLGSLGSTGLRSQIVKPEEIAPAVATARPVANTATRGGVTFNRGPRFDVVERAAGMPLPRAKLEGVVPGAKRGASGEAGTGSAAATFDEQVAATRRAAEEATRQARTIAETGSAPSQRLMMVRPALTAAPAKPAAGAGRAPGTGKAAAPDTTR